MGLFDIFSGDAAKKAAADKQAALQQGYSNLADLYWQGRTAISTGADQAQGYYTPLASIANDAYAQYGDAIGLNGASGNAAARARFQQGPGYDVTVKAALDAVDRGAAARGSLSSGGTIAAEQSRAGDIANQGWSQYLSSFAPYLSQAPQIAAGQAGVATGEGTNLASSFAGQGSAAYQLGTGVGDAQASGDLADYQASGNLWNAIFNAANLGANVLGYSTGKKKAA